MLHTFFRYKKALENVAKHCFNANDPLDPYKDCACSACEMGWAGDPVDSRGHDTGKRSCFIAEAYWALYPEERGPDVPRSTRKKTD